MKREIRAFLKDETGAVTVDWVMLTAALVGLAIAVTVLVTSGTEDLSGDISDEMKGIQVGAAW